MSENKETVSDYIFIVIIGILICVLLSAMF